MSRLVTILNDRLCFPDPATPLTHPNGLIVIRGDVSVPRLPLAYRKWHLSVKGAAQLDVAIARFTAVDIITSSR